MSDLGAGVDKSCHFFLESKKGFWSSTPNNVRFLIVSGEKSFLLMFILVLRYVLGLYNDFQSKNIELSSSFNVFIVFGVYTGKTDGS